jgi:hypothetical protein
LHSRRHQSKPANPTGTLCQPLVDSMNASPGRLMHSSVTSSAARSGSRSRNVRASADRSSGAIPTSLPMGGLRIAQLIDLTEIKITRNQDLNTVALVLGDGRRNTDRAFERFGGNTLR